jgi:leader peptidase (prepilin peptidase)/N-methyltransferase
MIRLLFIALFVATYISITASLFWTDWKKSILPNPLTISLILCGLGFSPLHNTLLNHCLGALYGGGIFVLIRLITTNYYKKEALGCGDIKLATGIGAYWGTSHILHAIHISFIMGGCIAVLLLLFTDKEKSDTIPFGPILISSSWLYLLLL